MSLTQARRVSTPLHVAELDMARPLSLLQRSVDPPATAPDHVRNNRLTPLADVQDYCTCLEARNARPGQL